MAKNQDKSGVARPPTRRGRLPTDITGQRFRMLTALYPTEKRDRNSSVIWHCRCDCGNEVDVPYEDLKYSQQLSCGCRKRQHTRRLEGYLTHAAGTSVDILKGEKLRPNNKTGVRGVCLTNGRYRADIGFQRKNYFLGSYKSLEEAAAVRKKAEQAIHGDFLEYYARWEARAAADPDWGAAHPISVRVERPERGDFRLVFEPELEG